MRRLSLFAGLVFTPLALHAAPAALASDAELRADRYADAAALKKLEKGTQVDTLKSEAGWVQVRAGASVGWVRANQLSGSGAAVAAVAAVEGGRSAPGNVMATSGIRSIARASRHALIIGVSQYMNPAVPTLKGVAHDMDSATAMAQAMGIPRENIRYIRDLDATSARIAQEIDELDQRTQPGDRVFLYYSGHGSRWYDENLKKDGCVEALLPADSKPLTNHQMAELLKPISDKTDKLFVFYDACHSGGVVDKPLVTRSFKASASKLTPKFSGVGAPSYCSTPANIKTRSFANQAQSLGGLLQNIVEISSSRQDEISFDDETAGGLATQAWRDCMLGEAKDLDNSGAISVDEISACAQAKLDKRFANSTEYSVQHLTIGGNKAFVPSMFASTAPVQLAQSATTTTVPRVTTSTSAATTTTVFTTTTTTAATAIAPHPPAATLSDVYEQRDARRKVSVRAATPFLKIGKDALDLSVTSSHDGYVYLVMLGSDNKSFYMLFPNDLDQDNAIKAGATLKLPRKTWKITAQGPAGTDRMLVVVSESPRDMSLLGNEKAGPFLTTLTDAGGRANLQWLLSNSANAASKECGGAAERRNSAIAKTCSDAFGAALTDVVEK
jgi:hypothetical protein